MAGGGAAAAAIIAAKNRRTQDVVDAFRMGDATAPDRARTIAELGIANYTEAEELVLQGVLVAGRREGTFYLHEAGYIAHRERRSGRGALAIVAIVLVLIGIALTFVVARQQ